MLPLGYVSSDSSIESVTNDKNRKINRILNKIGFVSATKITDTSTGRILRATSSPIEALSTKSGIVKISNKFLNSNEYFDGTDILLEKSILKYLTQNADCPPSIAKFHRFFKTSTDYWLLMEDAGTQTLLGFTQKAHSLIKTGQIDLNHWKDVIKVIFQQMIECIEYLHSMNVVHFDICLQSFLINDVKIDIEHRTNKKYKFRFITEDIQIKLINFGLAQKFTKTECLSSKHSGRKGYQSPEVVNKMKRFDAKKVDIWAIGICVFMLAVNCPPWFVAAESDPNFLFVSKYSVAELLQYWYMDNYVDQSLIFAFESIFQCAEDRICLDDIKTIF